MIRILAVVCCVSLLSLPAFAKKKAAKGAGMTDQQFVDFAAQTDMVEANLGQLAQTAAASKAATLRTRQDWVPQVPVWDLGS